MTKIPKSCIWVPADIFEIIIFICIGLEQTGPQMTLLVHYSLTNIKREVEQQCR